MAAEKRDSSGREQAARSGSHNRLDQAYRESAVIQEFVNQREKIRVKRGLVEDSLTHPIAVGDPPRPLMIPLPIAHAQIKEWSTGDLPQIDPPNEECDEKYAKKQIPMAPRWQRLLDGRLIGKRTELLALARAFWLLFF